MLGREYLLWRDGLLDRLPAGVRHAVLDGWREGDETVLVMRDLGDAVVHWGSRIDRRDSIRVLAAVALRLHAKRLRPAPAPPGSAQEYSDAVAPFAGTVQ
jgi:hypothetical protein